MARAAMPGENAFAIHPATSAAHAGLRPDSADAEPLQDGRTCPLACHRSQVTGHRSKAPLLALNQHGPAPWS